MEAEAARHGLRQHLDPGADVPRALREPALPGATTLPGEDELRHRVLDESPERAFRCSVWAAFARLPREDRPEGRAHAALEFLQERLHLVRPKRRVGFDRDDRVERGGAHPEGAPPRSGIQSVAAPTTGPFHRPVPPRLARDERVLFNELFPVDAEAAFTTRWNDLEETTAAMGLQGVDAAPDGATAP